MLLQQHAVRFVPCPSDVVMATVAKNGTTWVLHICHQLRMRGVEPDFEAQEEQSILKIDRPIPGR